MPRSIQSFTVAVLFLLACAAHAQGYPVKPIRWLVPSAPGGAFDAATRALAPAVSQRLGQPLVVDNRGGSAGLLGMDLGAHAAPDGYTLLTAGTSQLIFNKFFYAKLPYDPQKDYAPIILLADLPITLWVHSSVPVTSMKELIAYAKANPGKLNYGSAGVGHVFHLGMEMLSQRAGIELTHVPFKGVGPANQEFIAGRIQLMLGVPSKQLIGLMKEGRLRALAAASSHRFPQLPDVPTLDETGIANMEVPNWIGMVAPGGTPREILARVNREVAASFSAPEAVKVYEAWGMQKTSTSSDEFAGKIDRELAAWGPIIRKLNISLD